jgi:hypothetical protein
LRQDWAEEGAGQGCSDLAIGALHLAGRPDITEGTRWAGRNMHRPFQLLGLTP